MVLSLRSPHTCLMSRPSLPPVFAHPSSARSATQNAAAPSASYRAKITNTSCWLCSCGHRDVFNCNNLFAPLRKAVRRSVQLMHTAKKNDRQLQLPKIRCLPLRRLGRTAGVANRNVWSDRGSSTCRRISSARSDCLSLTSELVRLFVPAQPHGATSHNSTFSNTL